MERYRIATLYFLRTNDCHSALIRYRGHVLVALLHGLNALLIMEVSGLFFVTATNANSAARIWLAYGGASGFVSGIILGVLALGLVEDMPYK